VSREDDDNLVSQLVLDREDVDEFAVVPLGPAMGAGCSVNELRRDADTVADPP
jgi:hypothetical protein